MKMNELNGRLVKISPRSITVKDDSTGKTCGVVRNVCTFNNLQPNRQIDYWKLLRTAGIVDAGMTHYVVIDEGKIYFMYNTKPDEVYESCHADILQEDYNKHQALLKKVESAGIEIIRCHIL